MFAFLRTGAIASAFIAAAATLATPALAQTQTAPVISTPTAWTLPAKILSQQTAPAKTLPQPGVMPQLPVTPQVSRPVTNPFASLPAVVRPVQPARPALQTPRSLHDLVASYVNYGDQDTQEECLAKAVYFEARSESLEGQLAVADVVLNRTQSGRYPTTICEVVTQPWQFSFIRRGQFPVPDRSSRAWHNATAIASIASKRLVQSVPQNVLWYHADYVAPSWGRRLNRVTQIGTHIFYS